MYLLRYLCKEISIITKIYSGKLILIIAWVFIIISNWNPFDKNWNMNMINATVPIYLISMLIIINLYFLIVVHKIKKYTFLKFITIPSNIIYRYLVNPVNKELQDNLSSFILVTLSILIININSQWHLRAPELQNLENYRLMSNDLFIQSIEIIVLICGLNIINTLISRNIEKK